MSASSMSRTPHAACHSSGWCAEMLRQIFLPTSKRPLGCAASGRERGKERARDWRMRTGRKRVQVSSSEWCGKKWPNPSFNNPRHRRSTHNALTHREEDDVRGLERVVAREDDAAVVHATLKVRAGRPANSEVPLEEVVVEGLREVLRGRVARELPHVREDAFLRERVQRLPVYLCRKARHVRIRQEIVELYGDLRIYRSSSYT